MIIRSKLIKSIFFPIQVAKNRSKKLKFLKEFEKNQFLPLKGIRELQWSRLKHLLEYSYTNCPFYKRRFDAVDMKPDDIKTIKDFLKIPVLTKSDIQENLSDMISKSYARSDLIKDMTGGSTGSPLVFYYDANRLDSREASRMRHNKWTGWDIGIKVASLWGHLIDMQSKRGIRSVLRNLLTRRVIYLDALSLTEKKMFLFAERLNQFKPEIILAYANMIDIFARFIKSNYLSVPQPKGIITSAEVLLPERRKFIESVFRCEVFNRYGSREVGLIASECEVHEGLHINADNLYVELIKNGNNVKEGELGEVIITDLLNYGMPLIRYKIGDVARSCGDRVCRCGRGLPMIDHIEGRVTDFIITPDKKIISGIGLATYMITNIRGIKQIQLVQNKIDCITIRLVKNNQFSENSRKELLSKAMKFLGEDMVIGIEPTEFITNEPSGKFRFSISNINWDG